MSNGIDYKKGLELLGDIDTYNDMLSDWFKECHQKFEDMKLNKIKNDMPNYAIEVHSLKSDAKYLGFVTLADLSYQSELKSKANDTVFVNDNHDNVMNEARKMIKLSKMYFIVIIDEWDIIFRKSGIQNNENAQERYLDFLRR